MASKRLASARHLALLFTLTGFGAGPLGAWVGHDEVTVKGRFFDPGLEEELLARRTKHGLELVREGEVVWSDGFHVYLSEILGTCRDLRSGRDQVFYATSSGGSDGAMAIHFVAFVPGRGFEKIFQDRTASPELGRYFRFPERPADAEWLEPMAGMICAANEYMVRRKKGLEVYRALAPPGEPVPSAGEGEVRLVPQRLVARDLEPALVRSLLGLHGDLGEGFFRSTLAETELWRFELVGFHHFYASWGVLLLEDRRKGTWRSLYDVPRGDSKSFLVEPAIKAVGTDAARIDFCEVCGNWAAEGMLDLRTLEVRALGSSLEE